MAILGTVGVIIGLIGLVGLEDIPKNITLVSMILGPLFCLAWFPALFRSGIELDSANRRFREYTGSFGNEKGAWIQVSDADYLSIVGVNEKRTSNGRSAVLTFNIRACKVYFLQGDWHVEIYKASYPEAKEFAQQFAEALNLEINDINQRPNDEN